MRSARTRSFTWKAAEADPDRGRRLYRQRVRRDLPPVRHPCDTGQSHRRDPAALRPADRRPASSRFPCARASTSSFTRRSSAIEKPRRRVAARCDDRLRRYRGRPASLRHRPQAEHRGAWTGSAGVESATGQVKVDDDNRSSVPSIFAVGDVTDRVQLTPVAIREGQAFADTFFGNKPRRVDYGCIPSAVFSHPPLAGVGLTEGAGAQQAGFGQDLHLRLPPDEERACRPQRALALQAGR